MSKKKDTAEAPPARDPVCGNPIDPSRTGHAYLYEGMIIHFCSSSCLRRFLREPDTYLEAGLAQSDAAKQTPPA